MKKGKENSWDLRINNILWYSTEIHMTITDLINESFMKRKKKPCHG